MCAFIRKYSGVLGKQPNLKGVFGVTIVDTCSSLVSELKPRKER